MGTQGREVRVAVVDGDPLYRQLLGRALERVGGASLAATAPTLAVARSKLSHTPVDLVILAVAMGEESGVELLPWLRAHQPKAVTLLLTAGGGEAPQAVEAMLLGASSLVLKPKGADAQAELDRALGRAIAELGGRPPAATTTAARAARGADRLAMAAPRELIAVGASTGGPPVILAFLKSLPLTFEVPIVITQHMPAAHVPAFAGSLARESGRVVAVARAGERVSAGGTYLAGDNRHLRVVRKERALVLEHDDGPEENFCRPAVDPMFRSVARACSGSAIGVVMTGMGADGARGAAEMQGRGASLVIQDAETSAVWGMPGAVSATGVPCTVAPGPRLGPTVVALTSSYLREGPA